MWYKNAFAIGSAAEGTIRCTYATIYDKRYKPLFTLRTDVFARALAKGQAGEQLQKYGYYDLANGSGFEVYTGDGEEAIQMWLQGTRPYATQNAEEADVTGYVNIKFPLVWADQYLDETHKFVPVKLLFPAVEYIVKTLKTAPRKIKYTIYRLIIGVTFYIVIIRIIYFFLFYLFKIFICTM